MKRCLFPLLLALLAIVAGSCNFIKRDYANLSKSDLKELDEKGDAQASLQLGRMAIKEMDRAEAKKYFTKAAEQNIPEGLHNLALVNAFDKDTIAMYENLQKAVDMGFIPSKGWLGLLYIDKTYLNKRFEGVRLAEEAAEKGDKIGFFAMHKYKMQLQNHICEDGDEADEYLTKSIEAGLGVALAIRFDELVGGGHSKEKIYEQIIKYKERFPRLVERLINLLDGNAEALQDPYMTDGYYFIEECME